MPLSDYLFNTITTTNHLTICANNKIFHLITHDFCDSLIKDIFQIFRRPF